MESVYTHSEWQKALLARRRTCNTYHPGTRLPASTTVTHTDKNGNTSTQVVSNPTYDVFGNVVANDRPGTAADMTYSYDLLHGWLKGISSPSGFSEELLRETATNAQLSGNIGSMQWRNTGSGEQHRYDYTYDELGRLTNARYSSSDGISGRYDESVSYNPNGSITSLLRSGMRNDGTFGDIDNLTISYNGNQLRKVTDAAEALNYNGALDFNDGADADCEYQYDGNGALTRDSNRGITGITYDYGHHPITIRIQGKKKKNYNYYTADGRKLSSCHATYTPTGQGGCHTFTTTDLYVDGLILRDGVPLMWQFDGGYVDLDANGTPTSWNYYVTDHLGSTRKVVDSNDNVKETICYYPFGSEMRMQAPAQMAGDTWQPYRFTGKELDKQNGLNMYDFGARWFDVAGVPMWTSVDPLAEKYYNVTPYSYCAGDPVNKIDPDGRDGMAAIDFEKKTIAISQTFYYNKNSEGLTQQGIVSDREINNFSYGQMTVPAEISLVAKNGFPSKTWDVNGWNVSFTCDFIGLDSDEAVNKALETNPAANALCYDANLPSNGEWDPSSRTLTLGSHRGGMGPERGSTINHEIGHSWGLPHENLMPNSPIYGKDNKEGTGIMSYGSYRTIQNYEVEYGVEKILKNVPEDHPSSMNLHIK
jgi:RHS repeat-associated protein